MEQNYDLTKWAKQCPKTDCRKGNCKCGLEKVFLPSSLGDDSKDSPIAPKKGAYCNAIVVYEANGHIYIYSNDSVPTKMTSGEGGDYDEIIAEIQAELANVETNLSQETSARTSADTALQTAINTKQNKLTAGSNVNISNQNVISATNTTYSAGSGLNLNGTTFSVNTNTIQPKLSTAQMNAVNSGIDSTKVSQIATNTSNISTINGKIPSAATTENQLADKNFVNSSIATNTATFRGTYNLVTDLNLTISATESQIATALASAVTTVENNDYTFVQIPTSDATPTEISRVDRYKYNETTWVYEYSLNNSSFTAVQWAAINSGITSGDVTKLTGLANVKTIGTNLNLDANGELTATDTTYTHFTGATASTDGVQGLVPGPLAGDEDKFLKADGTWDTAGSNYTAGDGIDITNDIISATNTGKAKVLTTNDYNWPTSGTKTSVAIWLLEPGLYTVPASGVSVLKKTGTPISYASVLIAGKDAADWVAYAIFTPESAVTGYVNSYGNSFIEKSLITNVSNSLTSTSTVNALSANQGKVLNDKIGGDLSNLTTTDKTSLINAINEVAGQSGGGAIELTSADYDWPTGNPDGVALWNLDNGVYTRSSSVKVYYSTSGTISASIYPSFLSLQTPYSAYAYCNGDESHHPRLYYTGNKTTHSGGYRSLLTDDLVVTDLTTNNNTRVLAASQGKVLKDLIDSLVIQNAGAPTTSTVGTVGQLLEDTTNGKLYICTDTTGGTYTWTEVGAGGGGSSESIKALTSADNNWPTNNPTGIALWKLEPGIYRKGENGLSIWFCSGSTQSQANQQVDSNWSNYQGLFIVRPGIWNGNPESVFVDLMAFSSSLTSKYAYLQWEIDNSIQDGYYGGVTLRAAREKEFLPLTGTAAPTASTTATFIGQIYVDTVNDDAYICLDTTSANAIWKKITP